MKGIIAEINSTHMIVITKNGDFIKCRKLPNSSIGDEVNIPKASLSSIYKKISTAAAGFILLALLSSGVYAYYTPYSYVSIDINPSLELYVNRFDKVIGVHAFNKDAELVLEAMQSVKNKGIETAVTDILDSAADKGYLVEETENSLMIVVSSSSKKEEKLLTEKISKASTEALTKVSTDYEIVLEKTKVETYKKAKEQNISPGKVILANKFKEAMPELDEELIKHLPLKQAIEQIEDEEVDQPKKPDKSSAPSITAQKPKDKEISKSNIKNVKQLIKEKNEELGKKLEEKESKNEKSKGQEKDKEGSKNKDKSKDKENDDNEDEAKNSAQESFNNNPINQQPTKDKEKKEELKEKDRNNKDNQSDDKKDKENNPKKDKKNK